MDDLKQQLSDSNKDIRLAALKLLRKQALKQESLVAYSEQLLKLIESDDLEIRTMVLKVAATYINRSPYVNNRAAYLAQNRAMVHLLASIYLKALSDKIAAIRKEAIYGIDNIVYRFVPPNNAGLLLDDQALALIAKHIGDPGTDLDEKGDPLTPKGTRTIAEKAVKVIGEFNQHANYTPVFHQIVPALEEMHYYISNGILDNIYGQKLVDVIIEAYDWMIAYKRVPLPPSSFPDTYPNYIVELLSFVNNHQFHAISDSTTYHLRYGLAKSKTYIKDLVETLHVDSYENEKTVVLYILADAIENGHSLKYFIPRIQAAIAEGKIDGESLPEPLSKLLAQEQS